MGKYEGLSAAMAFYMLLVYVEFIGVNVLNFWSFQITDFIGGTTKFGTEAIKPNEVQLFEFEPKYDEIHDLHNYRRVYLDEADDWLPGWLKELDERNEIHNIADAESSTSSDLLRGQHSNK